MTQSNQNGDELVLNEDKAKLVVVANTKLIADYFEKDLVKMITMYNTIRDEEIEANGRFNDDAKRDVINEVVSSIIAEGVGDDYPPTLLRDLMNKVLEGRP